MPSRSIHSWTLISLIGSYFDLALAYFLLIVSTLTFFVPCPYRIQTLLFSWTRARIESLQRSILTRFPFDLIFKGSEPDVDGDRVVGGNRVGPVKGRRIRRRRVSDLRKGKWVSGLEGAGGKFVGEKSKSQQRIIEDDVSIAGESLLATKYCSVEDASSSTQHVNASIGETELIIKNLEQELEEARATHATLYLDLEKERSAAATAADEAMAMILRLQSEKAALELESQQYQRMAEEKSAYDGEEMEILKEIIVRRERENYVLENEIAMYQQMIERKCVDDELDEENQDEDQRGSNSSWFETESTTIDVHVIDDKHNLEAEEGGLASNISEVGRGSELNRKGGVADKLPSTNNVDLSTKTLNTYQDGVEQHIQEICRDMNKSGELIEALGGNASHFDVRGNSMSVVARERFKLETEVDFLRKRLKTIHQGRENLSFSMEYRERENVQLQFLEEIACHLQEIKKITEPGKGTRQTSLPPLSTTVTSKKRRC